MRVCKQSLAQIGLAVIAAPHLRPAQIETLIPRKAANEGRFLALQGQLVSIVGNGQTCRVGNILAQPQLALYMLPRQRLIGTILSGQLAGPRLKILAVLGRPPPVHRPGLLIRSDRRRGAQEWVRHWSYW